MRNKRLTRIGNYQTAWDDGWKTPCILEHLLVSERKTKHLIQVLNAFKLRLQAYTDNKWFDVVKV